MTTRRTFLTQSSCHALAAAAALRTPWHRSAADLAAFGLSAPPRALRSGVWLDDPDLKALAHRALDAATAAGASYADVRFTITQRRGFPQLQETKQVAVGVRALVRGAWGFMSDTALTPEMMDWLGGTAGRLAAASGWPDVPSVTLSERPPVANGHWETPVTREPWTVPNAEYLDLINSLKDAADARGSYAFLALNIGREARTFASTDGAFATQTLHTMFTPDWAGSSLRIVVRSADGGYKPYEVPIISPRSGGFEILEQERLLARLPEWIETAERISDPEPLTTPGRFDVVFDGHAMGALVSTLGAALEIDRALGYEANAIAGGTSYLAPVDKMLGTTPFAPGLTVTGNGVMAGGAATARWDDEGVETQTFPLIQSGTVVDYATSREFTPALAAGYRARGQTVQSRGCARSESALSPPIVWTPNLELAPGSADLSFMDLVAGVESGMAILGGTVDADQECLNVLGGEGAVVYTIKKGKLVGAVRAARYMARMPDLWRNLVALGGARSAETHGFTMEKGVPEQWTSHSVRAVAGRFKNVLVRSVSE